MNFISQALAPMGIALAFALMTTGCTENNSAGPTHTRSETPSSSTPSLGESPSLAPVPGCEETVKIADPKLFIHYAKGQLREGGEQDGGEISNLCTLSGELRFGKSTRGSLRVFFFRVRPSKHERRSLVEVAKATAISDLESKCFSNKPRPIPGEFDYAAACTGDGTVLASVAIVKGGDLVTATMDIRSSTESEERQLRFVAESAEYVARSAFRLM